MGTQDNWRFCTKCYSLFWYGNPTAGVCPAGAAHSPYEVDSPTHAGTSWDFALPVASTGAPPSSPGGGGGSSAAGTQGNWRFCTKCYSLFWYGNPTAGVCPAGAAHSPLEAASPTHAGSSWDFALQVASTRPLWTNIEWSPSGTGPLGDGSSTVGSGGNECQYQAAVTINRDGTCTFSGYYENRGNWTFPNIGTAPPQAFLVSFIVLDTDNNGYCFTYTGEVPSAPQPGATVQWNVTENCPNIAQNWARIATRVAAIVYWHNRYDESLVDWFKNVAGGVLNWLESTLPQIEQDANTAINDFEQALVWLGNAWGTVNGPIEPVDGGDDGADIRPVTGPVSRPPLPAGVPTGAAASVGGSSGLIAGTGAA